MYIEKSQIEIIELEKNIQIMGINLRNSGLPITFDSLGKMWDRYTLDIKNGTKNRTHDLKEYGVCLNNIPDYLVGVEVTSIIEEDTEYFGYTIASGRYVKCMFNAHDHEELVSERLMNMQKKAKKWAKENKVKCDPTYTVEVYPKDTVEQEYPEMYILIPVAK